MVILSNLPTQIFACKDMLGAFKQIFVGIVTVDPTCAMQGVST